MSVKSADLLPALRELPGEPSGGRKTFREIISDLASSDRALYAAEATAAASFALWGIFDRLNADDSLFEAYRLQYPVEAAKHSLYQNWVEKTQSGEGSMEGFVNGLKGKMAELNAVETLKGGGYSAVEIAPNPNQPVWDISASSPDGEAVFFQVKTGAAERAGEVESLMADNPDIQFLVSSEIYDRISERSPDVLDSLVDVGSGYELAESAKESLDILSRNMGLDIPDGVGDLIPYAGAIIAGARLIYGVMQTEKRFSAADRTAKNKIQVVQTLTIMSRMGISTVLATAGGMGGSAAGSAIPFVGNLIGGIAGTAAGAGIGMYLNSRLEPRMMDLALDITGLTGDDIFYYANKERVDSLAGSFRRTALPPASARPKPAR